MGARPRKGAERGPGAAVMPSRGRAPTLGSMRTKVKGEQDSQAVLSLTATIFLRAGRGRGRPVPSTTVSLACVISSSWTEADLSTKRDT